MQYGFAEFLAASAASRPGSMTRAHATRRDGDRRERHLT